MTYATEQAAPSRQVQWLVEIVLDRCAEVYTQGACTAGDAGDGLRCHYSYPTCQDPSNFNKSTRTLYFYLNDVPWPDAAVQAMPYLQTFVPVAQKIEPKKLSVTPAKITVKMAYDWEPPPIDHDKGSGFYNTARTGEFWRNLIARNRNYAGRTLRVLRGFNATGFDLADFVQIGPTYLLREIKRKNDHIEITAESVLAQLKDRTVPFEVGEDNTIQDVGGIDGVDTEVTVVDGTRYPDPDDPLYVRNRVYVGIGTEICELMGITGNVLTIIRGRLDTAATTHDAGDKVKHVLFIGTDNTDDPPTGTTPMGAIRDLLEWVDIDPAYVDTAQFDDIEESLWPSSTIRRVLWKPKKVAKLLHQLRESRQIALFINSSNKWTVEVLGPGVSTGTLTDDNFVEGKVVVDEDEDTRATRVALFYDPVDQNAGDDPEDYAKGVIYIDAGLEAANSYGEIKEKNFADPWLMADISTAVARNAAARLLTRFRAGSRDWAFELELVDGDYELGDAITLQSDLVVDRAGNAEARPAMISSKKEVKRNVNRYTAIDTGFSGTYMRIGADSRAEAYDSAAAGEGDSYWGDANGRLGAVNDPSNVFF